MKLAENMKSLDELNLGKRARNYLEKVEWPLNEIVRMGRVADLIIKRQEAKGDSTDNILPKWELELRDALDEAGFIRHDIDFRSLGVGSIYYHAYSSEEFDWSDIATLNIEGMTNEQYEAFRPVSEEDFAKLKAAIEEKLAEKPKKALKLVFALDGTPRKLGEAARSMDMSSSVVWSLSLRALRCLVRNDAIPPMLNAKMQNQRIDSTIEALRQLHEDMKALAAQEKELSSKLRVFSRTPAASAENAKTYLGRHELEAKEIDVLNLSTRCFNCLIRADIRFVADILDLPKENWPRIRNLGKVSLREVQKAMQEHGYTDFQILPD